MKFTYKNKVNVVIKHKTQTIQAIYQRTRVFFNKILNATRLLIYLLFTIVTIQKQRDSNNLLLGNRCAKLIETGIASSM